VDNGGRALDLAVSADEQFEVEFRPDLLGGINVLESESLTLIPYYAWSHRGVGEMEVRLNLLR
jgi:DUF1680 family protein